MAALIRNAHICKDCTSTKCNDLATDAEPLTIECPNCSGSGCEQCNEGQFGIKGCPNQFCSSIVPTLELIDLFQKGMPPINGGVLDQSASFIRAVKFFDRESQLASREEPQ